MGHDHHIHMDKYRQLLSRIYAIPQMTLTPTGTSKGTSDTLYRYLQHPIFIHKSRPYQKLPPTTTKLYTK